MQIRFTIKILSYRIGVLGLFLLALLAVLTTIFPPVINAQAWTLQRDGSARLNFFYNSEPTSMSVIPGGGVRASSYMATNNMGEAYSGFGGVNTTYIHLNNTDSWLNYPGNGYNYFRGASFAFNSLWYDENNTSFYVDPSSTSVFNALYRNYGFNGPEYDGNNTGYYIDLNSNSQFYALYRTYGFNGPEYDGNNGGYYIDPNGTSQYHALYRTYGFNGPEYDGNNGNFYVDPNGYSQYYVLLRNFGFNGREYDLNDTGYYLDPNDWSRSYAIEGNYFHSLQNDSWMPYLNGWNYFRGPTYAFNTYWYDENNSGYYINPDASSKFNALYRTSGFDGAEHDANDGYYYLDPNNWSRSNYTESNFFHSLVNDSWFPYINGWNYFRGPTFAFTQPWYDEGTGYYIDPNATSRMNYIVYDAIANGSDIRIKKDIQPIKNALDIISKLRGVTFKFNKDTNPDLPDGTHLGYIAQEVEPILPDVVHTDEKTGLKSIEYTNMVALMSEGIKLQQNQLTSLQKELDDFKLDAEGKLSETKAELEKQQQINAKQDEEIELLKQQIKELKSQIGN